jgi:phospholipid N-methyltransferase
MSRLADTPRRRFVAELGAGTGPITRALLDDLPPDGRLWAFEIKPDFAQMLRDRFKDPRLTIVEGSATEAPQIARDAGLDGFDAVVSAIPFSLLGRQLSRDLIGRAEESMLPGAAFVALQYHLWFLPPLLRERFGRFERHFFLGNVPPAQIFRCYRSR